MNSQEDAFASVPVAAVDNDRMALFALKGILPQLMPSARWLWGVTSGDEAVRRACDPETRPRMLLVDMSLGESTGINVCRRIRMRTDRVALLAITAFSVDTYAGRAADAGAQGIVSKADIPQLAKALRAVASGGTFNPTGLTGMLDSSGSGDPDGSAESASLKENAMFRTAEQAYQIMTGDDAPENRKNAPKLGAKEAETLHLLSRGLTYDQIAAQWGVATSTVRTHAHRAVDKLGAHSLAHAIALWLGR